MFPTLLRCIKNGDLCLTGWSSESVCLSSRTSETGRGFVSIPECFFLLSGCGSTEVHLALSVPVKFEEWSWGLGVCLWLEHILLMDVKEAEKQAEEFSASLYYTHCITLQKNWCLCPIVSLYRKTAGYFTPDSGKSSNVRQVDQSEWSVRCSLTRPRHFFLIKGLLFLILCVFIFPACTMCVQYPQEARRELDLLQRVMSLHVCWELNLDSLQEQQVLVTAEPSRQPQCGTFGSEVSFKAVFRKLGPNLWLSSEMMGPVRPREEAIVMPVPSGKQAAPNTCDVRLGISPGSEQQIQMTRDRNSKPVSQSKLFLLFKFI